MIDWFLGVVAECCWHIARFHAWRADRHEARVRRRIGSALDATSRAKRAYAAAERWAKRQQRADRVQMLAVEGPTLPRVSY